MKIKTLPVDSIEPKLFYLFSILNIVPIFLVKHYGSIDAPLHLYQSNVIDELWKSNELFEQFYKFNPVIVGNLTSQFMLGFFNFFFPAWIAEKILLTIYVLGLAFSFRYLILGINKKSSFISFLIFPFTYNTFFHFGHYNYVLGMLVMLIVFGYWVRVENNLTFQKILILLLLTTLLFLTHIFVYTFFVGSFGLYLLFLLFISLQNKKKFAFKLFFKKAIYVFLALIPSLILFFIYGKSISGKVNVIRLNFSTLINDLVNIKPLIGYKYLIESNENSYLFILLCILFILAIVNRIRLYRMSVNGLNNTAKNNFKFINPADYWLLLTFVFLLFYFTIPDKLTAGNISTRLNILLFTFFIIWLSLQRFSKIISVLTLVTVFVYSINIREVQYQFISELNSDIKEIKELKKYMEPNSVYYPMNFNPNWIKVHFLNYVSVDDPYVSALPINCSGTFPIIDTRGELPVVMLGDTDLGNFCNLCSNWNKSHPKKIVDYVIMGGATIFSVSENHDDIKTILHNNYNLIYTSSHKNIELYKVKKGHIKQ